MHPILTENIETIHSLCREYQVTQLDAFGSVLSDEFTQESDVDFVVYFHRDTETNAFRQYFEFKEALEGILDRPVDLVCGNSMRNAVFRKTVQASSVPLFAA
ncbi:nucleotidyltransferase family protein [Puniceicoccus vermicola]|uniref:Nucleotidyltransferase domain-containing protein n=1 Tax=Puniceicoccus vermicola TaxID=388746 RepID=A0A7X1AWF0_9BACT|nr:nucleotidyltransferase domain-containing protein [Puniceicoccus vermicola]MBC2601238.1 nucleotidyltransferase domain-containing protein [Puniceicoccus vermicola]